MITCERTLFSLECRREGVTSLIQANFSKASCASLLATGREILIIYNFSVMLLRNSSVMHTFRLIVLFHSIMIGTCIYNIFTSFTFLISEILEARTHFHPILQLSTQTPLPPIILVKHNSFVLKTATSQERCTLLDMLTEIVRVPHQFVFKTCIPQKCNFVL